MAANETRIQAEENSHPPLMKSLGIYKMPVHTNPLKIVNEVAKGPSFLTFLAFSSLIILRLVTGVLSATLSIMPYFVRWNCPEIKVFTNEGISSGIFYLKSRRAKP